DEARRRLGPGRSPRSRRRHLRRARRASGVDPLLPLGGARVCVPVRRARARGPPPDLVVGICGEHGGHPESIRFCHWAGLDYVSCSAPRVPIARLAAAPAENRGRGDGGRILPWGGIGGGRGGG